jgi:hypothetical protein
MPLVEIDNSGWADSVKLASEDGGPEPYDPDFQDMAIIVTISFADVALPATNPQEPLLCTLLLSAAAMSADVCVSGKSPPYLGAPSHRLSCA